MKKNLLFLALTIAFCWNIQYLFAQDNGDLAIAPFAFTASNPKEMTQNIKEVVTYSKSISNQFNQRVNGNLLLNVEDNIQIAEIDTKFDGNVDIGGADYSTISDFLGTDFRQRQNYYFVPVHDAPAWFECKSNGNVWMDLKVVKNAAGNNFIYRFFIPDKTADGKPYEPEYVISSVTLNDKEIPLPKGKKEYGIIKRATLYTDTIKSTSSLMRVVIKVKGLGKPYKLMYIDKSKGEDFSKLPIEGIQFYNLPAKSIVSDSNFFSMSRVGVSPLKPENKYQVCIVMTLSNGKECPLQKKNKFTVQPFIQEYKTGRIDSLKKRTITGKSGSLIYKYLVDIPEGTSSVQFNYHAEIACKDGNPDETHGHINSCSVLIFRVEE
jgi:hypothetical protein